MAPVPRPKRFLVEEYSDIPDEQKPTMERLFMQLNGLSDDLVAPLSKRLTITDNMVAEYRDVVATIPEVAWVTPTLENSWAAFSSTYSQPGYRIDSSGQVELRGRVASGSAGTAAITTLPAGHRPPYALTFSVPNDDSTGRLEITTAGVVALALAPGTTPTASVGLDGVRFYAASPSAPQAFVGSDWPLHIAPKTFNARIKSLQLVKATDDSDSPDQSHGGGTVDWDRTGTGAKIRAVRGLVPGRKYRMTFLLMGES